ncbi:ArnT family glycosyltransferase [Pseudomonas rhizoryzae]|uniref:ArnT family glycosyltransferase n=1 Tax=Pseudomonas rhizoryzae TaxID=2571129 RepID=UPI0007379FE8|nr:glycosyltransferase family 39 protein [Pseudomonas rhizoryzae]KTT23797.1 membrane protein [Pseudomonas psychrotolerans]KTT30440.1 membrane protein [Pseudomonas psychrotolerans]KTT36858.1 membrane protein [Pseudomonas psychrotolerans]KTT55456.1 membrane protein [Pseudomonas psychrotolerans]KTT77794.1 membrane protein [Pseudomonas psychrotolerans]
MAAPLSLTPQGGHLAALPAANRLRRESLLVGVVAALLFTLGIWNQAPQGFDGRWAVFLEEMFRHGPAFFPTTYGQPYPDYPATATWLSWLAARVIGAPNHLANVLPTALASAGVLALTYRLLADTRRAWALLTVLLVALTPQWLEKARAVCLDQLVALVVVLCFYLLYSADRDGRPLRRLLVLPLFALGFAIRGPLGLIEPCGVVCLYWLVVAWGEPAWRRFALQRLFGYGLVGLALLVLCWWTLIQLAHHEGGADFAAEVWHMQVSGRLDESGKPFWFYLQLGLYRYLPVLPLALLLLAAQHRSLRTWPDTAQRRLLLGLAGSGLLILIGLSIPHFKRAYYVVPMVPFLAALAAHGLLRAEGWFRRVVPVYLVLVLALPGLALVALLVCRHLWQRHGYWPDVSLPLLVAAFVMLQLAALVGWRRLTGTRRLLALSALALAAQWLMLVAVVEPAQDLEYDSRGFVQQVEGLRQEHPGPLVFFGLGQDSWAIRYIMNLDYDEQPIFVARTQVADLAHLPSGAWVILARADRDLLSGTPLANQQPVVERRLNGNPCLVYRLP